jgi:hypothetical protein
VKTSSESELTSIFVWIQVYHKRHPHPTDELRPVTKLKREGKLDSVVRTKTGRPCDGVVVEYAGTSCVPILRPGVEYESSRSGQSHGMPPHASIERRSHFHRLPAVSQHPSKAVKNHNLLTTCCMQNVGILYRRPHFPSRLVQALGGLEPKLSKGGYGYGMPKK